MSDTQVWSERVREWRASGQSASAYCAGQPFAESVLRYWWRRLRTSGEVERERGSAKREVRLARVEVVRPPTVPQPDGRRSVPSTGSGVAVEVGAMRIAVERAFDPATLAAVLEVVMAAVGARS